MSDLIPFTSLPFGWRDFLDITLITILFYNIILMVRQTRAVAAIYGLALIILAYFISRWVGLVTLNLLLENVLRSLFLIVIIVFQRDIRQALTKIGARHWRFWSFFRKHKDSPIIPAITEAALYMAERKIGALIIVERGVPLGDTINRGTILNAEISPELLVSIFWPNSPLHDGATIIREGKILAAGCILPLSANETKRDYGTRHRAAIGITEEADAVVVVVSEERGAISLCVGGDISKPLNKTSLPEALAAALENKL